MGRRLLALSLGLLTFLSANPIVADPIRRNWIYEQLSSPTLPTREGQSRFQVALQSTNLGSAFSFQGWGIVDFGWFEVKAGGSQRVYSGTGGEAGLLQTALAGEESGVSIEVARSHAFDKAISGRLGLEILQLFPSKRTWGRINWESAVLSTPEKPWAFRFWSSIWIDSASVILMAMEVLADVTTSPTWKLSVGLGLGWTYWSDLSNPVSSTKEQNLISLVPVAQMYSPVGRFRLEIHNRLNIDRLYDLNSAAVGYVSGWQGPAVALNWALNFD